MSERTFQKGKIEDVVVKPISKHLDERGWLAELWRTDNVPGDFLPVMSYISQTEPGVVRGPHEHVAQTDYFCFIGPGNFKIDLWDNREDSPTYDVHQQLVVGADRPTIVVVPHGVVHAYRNVSSIPGIVINCPDALYAGENYSEEVDEIRHEDEPDSPFRVE